MEGAFVGLVRHRTRVYLVFFVRVRRREMRNISFGQTRDCLIT